MKRIVRPRDYRTNSSTRSRNSSIHGVACVAIALPPNRIIIVLPSELSDILRSLFRHSTRPSKICCAAMAALRGVRPILSSSVRSGSSNELRSNISSCLIASSVLSATPILGYITITASNLTIKMRTTNPILRKTPRAIPLSGVLSYQRMQFRLA